jgi:hypothetical protein
MEHWKKGSFQIKVLRPTVEDGAQFIDEKVTGYMLRAVLGVHKSGRGWSLTWLERGARLDSFLTKKDAMNMGERLVSLFDEFGNLLCGGYPTLVAHLRNEKMKTANTPAPKVSTPEHRQITPKDIELPTPSPPPVSLLQLRRYAARHGLVIGNERYKFIRDHHSSVEVSLWVDAALFQCGHADVVHSALESILWAANGFDEEMDYKELICRINAA